MVTVRDFGAGKYQSRGKCETFCERKMSTIVVHGGFAGDARLIDYLNGNEPPTMTRLFPLSRGAERNEPGSLTGFLV